MLDARTAPPGERHHDAVWRALASHRRRRLLDLLGDGPLTTGDLAERTPELSRYAVMQHLAVLEAAGLVLVRRRGRHRFNYLNAVPLREAYERWVVPIADAAASTVTALRRHIEQGEKTMSEPATPPVRTVHIENELRFRASPDRVFEALTQETTEWFPHSYGGDRVVAIVTEPGPGGRIYEDWGEGTGHLYGVVQHWDPPHRWTTRAWLGLGVGLDTRYEIEADGDETVLRMSRIAVGPLTDDEAAGIAEFGDLSRFDAPLRAWIERAG